VDDRELRLVAASADFGDADPALELWQRLCVPIRHRGMLVGFAWITDRFGDLTAEQVAEAGRAAQEIGGLLHARLVTGERERELRQELVEQLQDGPPVEVERVFREQPGAHTLAAYWPGCWRIRPRRPCCLRWCGPRPRPIRC
jgi:hypothetical protein